MMGAFTAFLLLMVLAVPALSDTCPDADKLDPCTCSDDDEDFDLVLSCFDDSTTLDQLKAALKAMPKTSSIAVELDELKLGSLPSNLFQGLNVKKLDISHCELDSLSEGNEPALSGLEDTLEELVIMSSFTEIDVPASIKLSHLNRLEELDLSYNVITELGNDWFESGPTSLKHLTISNCYIEKLGSKAFASLVNLNSFALDGNRFGPISRSMLPSKADRLQTMELDNNAFTSIPGDLFTGMPALRSISLRTNGITELPQNTWHSVWSQLEDVSLDGNPLDCDSRMDWVFTAKQSPAISGKCEAPPRRKGKHLRDLIQSKGE